MTLTTAGDMGHRSSGPCPCSAGPQSWVSSAQSVSLHGIPSSPSRSSGGVPEVLSQVRFRGYRIWLIHPSPASLCTPPSSSGPGESCSLWDLSGLHEGWVLWSECQQGPREVAENNLPISHAGNQL